MVITEKEHVDPSTCRIAGCTIICYTARHSKTKLNLVNNKENIASDKTKRNDLDEPHTKTNVSG